MTKPIETVRRTNALILFQTFAEEQIAAGAQPLGLQEAFASRIGVKPSMWSQIKRARPISDKLARQIEAGLKMPAGWMDEEREPTGVSPGEQHFLALALQAYRRTDSAGRKALKQLVKTWPG